MLNYELKKDIDTRNNTPILLLQLKENINNFHELQLLLKPLGLYYSRFKKGFITTNIKLTDDDIKNALTIAPATTNNKANPTYYKYINEWLTLDELLEKLKNYVYTIDYQTHRRLWRNYFWRTECLPTLEEERQALYEKLAESLTETYKNDDAYYRELKLIRQAIIHKSLGGKPADDYWSSGNIFYDLIWDKLPIIDNLKVTDTYYNSVWGYDQTNVTLAYKLNLKCWGLTVFKLTDHFGYVLKRVKDDATNWRFKPFMHFTLCTNPDPEYYLKIDASRTGFYR